VFWTELRVLIVDTGRVWWRLLPMIMGVYLFGWRGTELTLRVAVIAGTVRRHADRIALDDSSGPARTPVVTPPQR
jgi:hypothetical protein